MQDLNAASIHRVSRNHLKITLTRCVLARVRSQIYRSSGMASGMQDTKIVFKMFELRPLSNKNKVARPASARSQMVLTLKLRDNDHARDPVFLSRQ